MRSCLIWIRWLWIGLVVGGLLVGCSSRLPSVPGPGDTNATSTSQDGSTGAGGASGVAGGQGTIEERERQIREDSLRREMEQNQSPQDALITRDAFLSEDIRFDYNSFVLSAESKQILERKAQWLMANPNISVQVEGHCDERGTVAYNLALGERRANVVKQYITALGVEESRLNTISYGEEFALDLGHNEAAWARNRRAHFAILNP